MAFIVPKISLSKAASMFGKPTIETPKDLPTPQEYSDAFIARVHEIEIQNANEFLQLLLENIETDKYNLRQSDTDIKLHDDGITPAFTPEDLVDGLQIDGDTVSVSDKRSVSGISFSDLAYLLEYGRKDKGIPPRDVFRRTFADFRKQAVQNVLNF